MAFLDEILKGELQEQKSSIGIDLRLKTKPWAEPLTLADFKKHLGVRHSVEDETIEKMMIASRSVFERITGICLMEQEWVETLNRVPVPHKLSMRPALSMSSVEYINGWEADTLLPISSSTYILTANRLVPRATWPYHRGFQSFVMTYKCGYASKGAADETALTAARAAIDEDIILTIKNLGAWFYENREGQGHDAAFKAAAAKGSLPPMVSQLLQPFIDWGF